MRKRPFGWYFWLAVLLAILILFSRCSPTYHIKRAKKKDPSLFEMKKEVVIDTVWKEVKKVDTIFKYTTDTMFINKDSVKIKFVYSYQDSLVYIEADCPDCPSINRTEKTTETIFIQPTFWQKFKWGFIGALMALIARIILRVTNVV